MFAVFFEFFIFLLLTVFLNDRKKISFNLFDYKHTDILKGIAILIIIIQHTGGALEVRYFTPFGGIGVALFLILSGYGLSESYKKIGLDKFWSRKIIKLWLPYSIVLILIYLLTNKKIVSFEFLLDITFINSSFWYMSFLIYNYAIFYFTHSCKFIKKYKYIILIIFNIIIFVSCPNIMAEQSLSFLTGIIISDYKNSFLSLTNKNNFNNYIFILLVISIIILLLKQLPSYRNFESEGENLITKTVQLILKYSSAMFIVLASSSIFKTQCGIFSILRNYLYSNRFLVFCSKISLELYLIHFTLKFMLDKNNQISTCILFLILSFSLSYILNYSVKLFTKSAI